MEEEEFIRKRDHDVFEKLKDMLVRYTKELDGIIEFWEKYGIDKEGGGYFTCLDRDGAVFDTNKYLWMQWRIVYMFATLYTHYEKKEKWLEISQQGFNWLTLHGKDSDGMYYFALNQKGEPVTCSYNIYSEAFAMMGSAALYKATNDVKYKTETISAMNHYIERLKNPKGKWSKVMPGATKWESHGRYMILANLGSVYNDCLGDNTYDHYVDDAVDKVLNHFWSEEHQILFENLTPHFSPDLSSPEGRHLNIGHGLESAWFMLQYAERSGKPNLVPKIVHAIKTLLNFGWDKAYGGIFYFQDFLGKPHQALEWDMKLWWVHNEAILSCLYGFYLSKDNELFNWFEKIDEWTFSHFSDPEYGEWFGYLNRRGEPTHSLKGGKWKTFFHLPRCLLFSVQIITKLLNQ